MRLTFEQVSKEVIDRGDGYNLLEFTKSTIKMKLLCPNGHEFEMYISNFRKGQRCSKCVGGAKLDYKDIKKFIEDEGYTLLSKRYINNMSNMRIKCPNGHEFETKWSYFKRGTRCPICKGINIIDYNYIKEYISNEGYTLLSKRYINSQTKMEIKCSKGHIYKANWNLFQQGSRCPVCTKHTPPTNDYIEEFAHKRGYMKKSDYKDAKSKMLFLCPNGHEFEMSWNNFQQGQECPTCARSKTSSKAEKEILDIAKKYCNVVIPNDRTQLINPLTGWNLELDVWMPKLRKAIEFNGTYWHSSKYSKWKDMQKMEQCKSNNIELLIIEEDQWYKDRENMIRCVQEFVIG